MVEPDILIGLLKEMAEQDSGIVAVRKAETKRYHHALLLKDAGFATWCNPNRDWEFRITYQGYQHLLTKEVQLNALGINI